MTGRELKKVGAVSMAGGMASDFDAGPGGSPRVALHQLVVRPVATVVAKVLLERHHYLHSMPGATQLALGIFVGPRLLGALTLGAGSSNGHRLVEAATPKECLTLTRLWLSDDLPKNSESHVLGMSLRMLRRQTTVRFVLAYADPSAGHLGTIYQAANFLYTGLSDPTPVYQVEDRPAVHSCTFSQVMGTRNMAYLKAQGLRVQPVYPAPKHRYIYFLDPSWRDRLLAPLLPHPKKEAASHGDR